MEVPSIWAQQLESKQLLFGFDNGEVTSICPSQDDPVWAVNFKRAVLSVFQTIDGNQFVLFLSLFIGF